MAARWRQLASRVDTLVDFYFAEVAVLRPWQKSEYVESSPDTTRPVTVALGVERSAASQATSLGGQANVGGGFIGREVQSDLVVSMRRERIEACGLKKGDRVELPDRDLLCEVSWVYADHPTDRPDVHLLRLSENPYTTFFGEMTITDQKDVVAMTGTVT